MNENTVFVYENALGSLTFAYNAPLWITDFDGLSSVDIDISESRSNMQIGSSVAGQSVRPRSFTLDGAIFDPIPFNRKRVLDILAPQVPSTLTVKQNNESWYLDVIPEKTPEITPGNGMQQFQVRLHAAYPYWRTTTSYARQVAGMLALFKFPFNPAGSWWVAKFSDTFFSTLENRGNVPIEFKLVFTARGALSNPEVYHVDARKLIRVNKTMIAGERVVVSTVYGERGITCISASGEVTNGFKYLSIDSDLSMTLLPGANLLRIAADVNREALGVRIEAPEGVRSGV